MPQWDDASSLDVPFSVPQVHRLRFTEDVLGRDSHILADLLEPTVQGRARVQFWADQELLKARPELKQRIRSFCDQYPHLNRVGNVQIVPGGEPIKNDIHILERMLKVFNAADLDRRSYVVVIGGGAVLDAVGFAAAIAHRGIRLVRLPTTTLAQGDSGIGVKNGVNLFQKKNWLGSFAVPWGVVNDVDLLSTLSDRDFISGFSEAVKVALLKSPEMFEQLCGDAKRIRQRDPQAALQAIQQSAQWHLKHITLGGDPFEMREARPLDYGHWSAHRLEAMTDFQLRHGEAVAIGVAIDSVYSSLCYKMSQAEAVQVVQCLLDLGFGLQHDALEQTQHLHQGLEEFRQHLGGRLTLTMLDGVGKPFEVHEVQWPRMLEAIEIVRASAEKRQPVCW